MSASLVGSEMCIRDSLHALGPAPRRRMAKVFALKGHDDAVPFTANGPVSYTHLTLPTICSV
eukprot:1709417-Alexandrium_andersonii.AAC.1